MHVWFVLLLLYLRFWFITLRALRINDLHYTGNTCELIGASSSSVVPLFLSSYLTKSWFYYLISSSGQGLWTQVLSKSAERNIYSSSLPSAGGMGKQLMANKCVHQMMGCYYLTKGLEQFRGFIINKYSRNTCQERISANFSLLPIGSPLLFMLAALPEKLLPQVTWVFFLVHCWWVELINRSGIINFCFLRILFYLQARTSLPSSSLVCDIGSSRFLGPWFPQKNRFFFLESQRL